MDYLDFQRDEPSDVYVPWIIKSAVKKDRDGNYIFEVEASNENLDLDNQKVQQKALLESKDFFLTNGVISDDHLHNMYDSDGNPHSDKTKIIGEPIDVYTKGTRTFVKGKLYSNIEAAKPYINLLKNHSTRVKASVGGIRPKILKNADGSQTVTAFKWNDLALTCSPVNYTVGSAQFVKSMSTQEFCKSLAVGENTTNTQEKTGGGAFVKEDLEKATQDAIDELLRLAKDERVNGKDDAVAFLMSKGIEKENAEEIASEIINEGGEMMKKSFSEQVSAILKSLGGGGNNNGNEGSDNGGEGGYFSKSDEGSNDESKDDDGEGGEGGDDGSAESKDDDDINFDDDDDDGDGSAVIKALAKELQSLKKSIKELHEENVDLGNSMLGIANIVKSVADAETPVRSVLNKSMVGGGSPSGKRPSVAEFDMVKDILAKSVRDGEISVFRSTAIEGEVQKSMRLGTPMSDEAYNFICERMPKGGK